MKKEEIAILKEIQKNTEMAIKAIDTISDKVHDERLASEISKESIKYGEMHNGALKQLVEAKAEPYHSNSIDDFRLKIGIHVNTMLNTSTGHVAELMIKGNNVGILDMEKVLKHNKDAGQQITAMAKDLIQFKQKNIDNLKSYL